jgi:hypothetical protein
MAPGTPLPPEGAIGAAFPRMLVILPPDTESSSLSCSSRYCDASLPVLVMIPSPSKAAWTIQSLVRRHWLNAVAAHVNWFTGGTQIRLFVMAITTESDGAPLT